VRRLYIIIILYPQLPWALSSEDLKALDKH
jgi:hypothetical protein